MNARPEVRFDAGVPLRTDYLLKAEIFTAQDKALLWLAFGSAGCLAVSFRIIDFYRTRIALR